MDALTVAAQEVARAHDRHGMGYQTERAIMALVVALDEAGTPHRPPRPSELAMDAADRVMGRGRWAEPVAGVDVDNDGYGLAGDGATGRTGDPDDPRHGGHHL